MKRGVFILSALLAAVALAACAQPGGTDGGAGVTTTESVPTTGAATGTAETTGPVLTARLDGLNDSGVSGEATVTIIGTAVRVRIAASGLIPGQVYSQHIHSLATTDSTCPPPAAAGTVTLEPEAEKYYGEVLVPLQPFPTATDSGTVEYAAQINGVPANALPLEGRAIVLHGLMVDGRYDETIPIACGVLRVVSGTMPPSADTTGGAETTQPGDVTETPSATDSVQTTP